MTATVLTAAQSYWQDCWALRRGSWPPPSVTADHLRQLARNAESPAVRARAAAELERTQWRARESETQEALQAIGEEFGFHGGEPRTAGVRRVLIELLARAEAAERRVRELEVA